MRAEKLILKADQQGVLHGLPIVAPNQEVEVILLMEDRKTSSPAHRRKPSPRLANQGASLQGDDMKPAIPIEDWGSLYNESTGGME